MRQWWLSQLAAGEDDRRWDPGCIFNTKPTGLADWVDGGSVRGREQSRMTPELGTYTVPLHFWFWFGGGERWETGETQGFSAGKR